MLELLSMSQAEMGELLASWGQPAFRKKQLFSWLHQGTPFEQMLNLPNALRVRLRAEASENTVSVLETIESKIDGTVKLLYRLLDGNVIEGVLMRYKHGNTLCLSTQVGCKMGCAFCASTLDGCVRNLSAGEMLGQVVCANRVLGEGVRVHNIVLMGSGEPLDNYENTTRFLRLLREPDGVNIGLRNVSLSTCGLVPQMYAFADEDLPVTLSVSLHAPNDDVRRKIMPVANRYSIEELIGACKNYIGKTGRRVIFEYALISGVNASVAQAHELSALLRGMQCHVNLIPLNSVPERGLQGVSEREISAFKAALEERHISVTRRREMGDDIEGACGQLRRKYIADTENE